MCKLVFHLEPNFNERQTVYGLLLSSVRACRALLPASTCLTAMCSPHCNFNQDQTSLNVK